MTLTGPPSGKDDDTGLGYDDTPAGNIWRQTAGPATPGLPAVSPERATGTGG